MCNWVACSIGNKVLLENVGSWSVDMVKISIGNPDFEFILCHDQPFTN